MDMEPDEKEELYYAPVLAKNNKYVMVFDEGTTIVSIYANDADFVKWSDGTTTREKAFIMTEDVTIKPLYGEQLTVNFEPNGGSPTSIPPIMRYPNEALGTLPEVTKDNILFELIDFDVA